MKTYPLHVPENEIETEAEMHAEETRKAVAKQAKTGFSKNQSGRQVTPSAERTGGRRK